MASKLLFVTAILLASLSWLTAAPAKLESAEIRDNESPNSPPKPEKYNDEGPPNLPKEVFQELYSSPAHPKFQSQKYQSDEIEKLERRDDRDIEGADEGAFWRKNLEFLSS